MFTNKIYEGIFYSIFVASWTNTRGTVTPRFKKWLKSLTINGKPIPEDIINEIYLFGTNGKLELEESAKRFIETW